MRLLASVCILVVALAGASAKILTVSGRGVLLSAPPPNVYSTGPNDTPSATVIENGVPVLAVTAFNEKQGVVLQAPLKVSDNPTLFLQPGIPYDSSFLFFHQKRPSLVNIAASAEFMVDNRFVGCALDAGNTGKYEIITTPYFGLPEVAYPTSEESARCFEGDDGVLGAGTNFSSHHTITQPGDYVRCFSATCVDNSGNSCQCSTSFNPICLSPVNQQYACFANVAALLSSQSAAFQFSSTCPVDVSSVVGSVQSCDSANGCKLQSDGSFCLKSSSTPSSVSLRITAGCGCDQVVTATFQGSSNASGCATANVDLDPPSSSCGANCGTATAQCDATSATASSTSSPCVSLHFNC